MALSGSFTGATDNINIKPTITWSATQNITGNYSTVTAILTYSRVNSGYTTKGTWKGSIVVNGSSSSGSKYITITQNSNTEAMRVTVQVPHNSDGTKIFTLSATGSIADTTLDSTSISASITLDTIPRMSTVSASSFVIGNSCTITVTKAVSTFTHILKWSFGSAAGTITKEKTSETSVSWTPAVALLAPQMQNSASGTGTITCITYSGETVVGSTNATFTATLPDSVVPSISSVSITEATNGIAAKFGVFIQNKSTLNVSVSASGVYGSTIKTHTTKFQGVSYSGNNVVTSEPKTSGTLTLTTTVIDSRGRTATKTSTISVVAYSNPSITQFGVSRCDANGNDDTDGDYAKLSYTYSVSPISDKNSSQMKIEYKRTTATQWASTSIATSTAYSESATMVSTVRLLSEYSYDVRISVSDYFGSSTYTLQLYSAEYAMDVVYGSDSKIGVAIGKAATKTSTFEVGWDTVVDGDLTVTGNIINEQWADYVEGQGIDGIWDYEKMASGRCKLWGKMTIKNVSCSSQISGWYFTGKIEPDYYPFPVTDAKCIASYESGSGSSAIPWIIEQDKEAGPPAMYLMRPSSATLNGNIMFVVEGRWK